MSTAPIEPDSTPSTTPEPPAEVERTFTQAEVDRIVSDRLKREGVAEAKRKAAQFDELQESSKSELQRLAEQVETLTKAQQAEAVKAVRYRIAAEHKLSTEDADLFLTGADEEIITAQAKRLADRGQEQRQHGGYAPNEGQQPPFQADERRKFSRDLVARSD